jgi:hypothetical protein
MNDEEERKKEFDRLIENQISWRYVSCPECESGVIHVKNASYHIPNDSYISKTQVELGNQIIISHEEKELEFRNREFYLEMRLSCEYCEYEWVKIIAFHKGNIIEEEKRIEYEYKKS